MRIERLTVREIELPLRSPFVTATGSVTHRRLLLVDLQDDDGAPGWAECVAGAVPGYTSETVDSAWDTVTGRLAPQVVGLNVENPAQIITAIIDNNQVPIPVCLIYDAFNRIPDKFPAIVGSH